MALDKNKTVWQRVASFVKDELEIDLTPEQIHAMHVYILLERNDARTPYGQ